MALRWLGKRGEAVDYTYATPRRADEPLRQRPALARGGPGRAGLRPGRTHSRALRRRARHAQEPRRVLPDVLRVRSRADSRPDGDRPGSRARHHRVPVPAEDRRDPGGAPGSPARAAGRRRPRAHRRSGNPGLRHPHGARRRAVRHRADGPGGDGAAPFHQRHHRPAQGRGARARGRRRPPHHGAARARSPSGGCLLVHRGSGLGHRDVLRDHRAADLRDHQHRGRGRVRRRALVRHPAGAARDGLVHRADRDPHDDEDGGGARAAARSPGAAVPRQRGRAAQPGGGRLGTGSLRPAVPRQLVADRDGRDHDRQLRGHGHPPGLHGPPAAGRGGRHRPEARRGSGGGHRGARRAGRAGAPPRVALHVPRRTGRSPSATASASRAASTSRATSPGGIATATSGSSGAPTT